MALVNESTIKNIEKRTGISVSEIMSSDVFEIDKKIENKIGKKLSYSNADIKLPTIGRGSPYLYLKRILKSEIIDKEINDIWV